MYSDKGAFVATGLVQHSVAPSIHPATKQVLLDTRDDKLRISYQQPVDKETLNTQPAGSYETKGEERLDTSSPLNKPDLVQQMSRPLPAVPLSAPAPIPAPAPVLTPAPAVQSGGVIDRLTSESEPRYVTVYEDGAALFSPRTINLLGTAARLPPPAPPTEPSTPTAAMQSPARSASMNNPLTTESVVAASAVSSTLPNTTAAPAPIAPAPVAVQSTQAPAAVAVPSWPPTESDHNTAAVSRVVEASTVREESPLLVGVEKETQSPLIASAGPQPYELVHPKNAIDVVELPPPAPKLPTTEAEMVANNAAPLPLPPSAQVVARAPEPVVAPTLLPATVVTTRGWTRAACFRQRGHLAASVRTSSDQNAASSNVDFQSPVEDAAAVRRAAESVRHRCVRRRAGCDTDAASVLAARRACRASGRRGDRLQARRGRQASHAGCGLTTDTCRQVD